MSSQHFVLQLKTVINNFSNRWSTEKSIDRDINRGKAIIVNAAEELVNIISSRPLGFSENIQQDIIPIIRRMRELENHQLYSDGGASRRDFWDKGDEISISLKQIVPTGN